MGIRTSVAFCCAVAALSGSGRVVGGEPDPLLDRIAALEKKVELDVGTKIPDDLVSDARAAAELYKDTEGKDALRDRALDVVGSIVKVRQDEVAKAAIAILGDIGDKKGAKFLRGFLRPINDPKMPVALEATLAVIPKLPDDSLIEPLLMMVDMSKNFAVAAKAIEALGSFGAAKSKREKILVELVKSVQKNQPGGRGKMGGGGSAMDGAVSGGVGTGEGNTGVDPANPSQNGGEGNRWGPLSAALPDALNKLTGTTCGSAQEWFAMVKEHKAKLAVLFVAETETKEPKK